MDLIKILEEQILHEGRLEDAIEFGKQTWIDNNGDSEESLLKYENGIKDISAADPSGNNKYLKWSTIEFSKGGDKNKIIDAINKFDRLQPKLGGEFGKTIIRDSLTSAGSHSPIPDNYIRKLINDPKNIEIYPDLDTLVQVVEYAIALPSRKEVKSVIEKDETQYVYENSRYAIVIPKTHRSSCHWGRGTAWCTKLKDNNQWFNNYSSDSYLFYLIDKHDLNNVENPLFKLCVRWYKKSNKTEIWNSFDTKLGEDLKEFFPPDLIEGMATFTQHEQFVYKLIDEELLDRFTGIDKANYDFVRTSNRSIWVSKEYNAETEFSVSSETGKMTASTDIDGGGFIVNVPIDPAIITTLSKAANIKSKTFKLTPEDEGYLYGYVGKLIVDTFDKMSDKLNVYKVNQITQTKINSGKNSLGHLGGGDWVIIETTVTDDDNTVRWVITWPDDPDEDKLIIKSAIQFNDIDNAEFSFVGILKLAGGGEQEYDKESEIVDLSGDTPQIMNDPFSIYESFKEWCSSTLGRLLCDPETDPDCEDPTDDTE